MAEWVELGDRAIRFARPPASSPAAGRAIVRAVRAWPGVVDVVVTAHDVGVYFDGPPRVDPARIRALAELAEDADPGREIELRAIYDGPDLDEVASATGLALEEIVQRHGAATYVVETMGFAPGFAYLAGLDARLELPRRATPRPRVPAGSVGIAGAHTTVYPFDSPGGWHLIARVVGVTLFGPEGALLQIGDRVRFRRAAP